MSSLFSSEVSPLASGRFPMVPVGSIFTERSERGDAAEFAALSVGKSGVTPQLENVAKSADISNRKLVRRGDIVINSRSDRRGASGLAAMDGTVSVVYTALRPSPLIDGRYAHHMIRSVGFQEEYYQHGTGIVDDLWSTRYERMATIRVPLPPRDEQRRIADYLDRETAEIDAMDAELDRLVETLRERREAVFDTALTDQTRFASLAWATDGISTGPFGTQVKQGDYQVGGTPLINPSHIRGGQVVPDERVAVGVEKTSELARHAMSEGEVVVARRGDLGRCAVIGRAEAGFLCGTGSLRVIPNPRLLDSRYAALVISSRGSRTQMLAHSVGATMDNLNEDLLGRVRIPLPPLHEQRRIVAELDEQTSRIDDMIADASRLKALLAERRATLITEVVTGQKEVPA